MHLLQPDSLPVAEGMVEDEEPVQRRQQLINFGHSEWGFNNWNWTVTKQELGIIFLNLYFKYNSFHNLLYILILIYL